MIVSLGELLSCGWPSEPYTGVMLVIESMNTRGTGFTILSVQ